jgi:hypothetical protein
MNEANRSIVPQGQQNLLLIKKCLGLNKQLHPLRIDGNADQ